MALLNRGMILFFRQLNQLAGQLKTKNYEQITVRFHIFNQQRHLSLSISTLINSSERRSPSFQLLSKNSHLMSPQKPVNNLL